MATVRFSGSATPSPVATGGSASPMSSISIRSRRQAGGDQRLGDGAGALDGEAAVGGGAADGVGVADDADRGERHVGEGDGGGERVAPRRRG